MTGAGCVKVATKSQPTTEFGVKGSKTVADLIDDNVTLEWTGKTAKVKGKIKNISTAWTEFDSKSENTGHFFPVVLDASYDKKEITVIGKRTRKAQDRFWILRVENAKGGEKGTFQFKCEETELFTLDFSEATLDAGDV